MMGMEAVKRKQRAECAAEARTGVLSYLLGTQQGKGHLG